MIFLPRGARVVFQGDSITDAQRDRKDPISLGSGYAMIAAARFLARFPQSDVQFLNRGIGGDRTKDLLARWDHDCLSLQPNLVSLLVGINNVWRRYDANDPTPVAQFAQQLDQLLLSVRTQTKAQILLMEPFLLPIDAQKEQMREDLIGKIDVTRRMARQYGAAYIALDGLFAQALMLRDANFWTWDGIHPRLPGAALIANAWLEQVSFRDQWQDAVPNPGPGAGGPVVG